MGAPGGFMHAQGFVCKVWFWPPQGPLLFGTELCGSLWSNSNFGGSNNNFFFVKNGKVPRTRWDSLLALTRQNGAAKAPSIGTAPIQRRRIFSLKKHRIDGFPPPFSPEKSQNASAGVPKRRRESAHRRDEATLAQSFFVAEKTCKKNEK